MESLAEMGRFIMIYEAADSLPLSLQMPTTLIVKQIKLFVVD
jgi:hypothetical protein